MKEDISGFERHIKYKFKNRDLLESVFLHPSLDNNIEFDRLEWLGDAILCFVTRKFLVEFFPQEKTGNLVLRFINMTKTDSLSLIGKILNIDLYTKNTGPLTNSVLADTVEALIGAIYLDSTMKRTEGFIKKYIIDELLVNPEKNSKNLIQEWAQKNNYDIPVYNYTGSHRNFICDVFIMGTNMMGSGNGASKKEASICAAMDLWKKISKKEFKFIYEEEYD